MKNKTCIFGIGKRGSDFIMDFAGNKYDDFFEGTITRYGDNKNGNMAFNVTSGIQLSNDEVKYAERNEALDKEFIETKCREINEKYRTKGITPLFMPYSVYYAAKIPTELKDQIICSNDPKLLSYLNSKFFFKKMIDGKISQPKYEFMTGEDILKVIKSGEVPNKMEIVVQTEFGTSGRGTYMLTKKNLENPIEREHLLGKIKPDETYVVTDFVKNICSASFQIQLSSNEVATYPPGIQIMKGPAWFGNNPISFPDPNYGKKKTDPDYIVMNSAKKEEIKKEIETMAQEMGKILRNVGNTITDPEIKNKELRGFMGIDVIISDPSGPPPYVHAIEINPRFTGATGLLNILSQDSGAGSVFKHTFDAFYAENTNFGRSFKNIIPNGLRIHADVEPDAKGHLISKHGKFRNQEGFDQATYQEEDLYTHAVYVKKITNYNTFDDRAAYKKYIETKYQIMRKKYSSFPKQIFNRRPEKNIDR